eukprot:g3580.t1
MSGDLGDDCRPPSLSFRQLFLHHFKKSLLGSTVNVVSIFAAIHLTRLLKRVYNWQHDEDGNTIAFPVALVSISVSMYYSASVYTGTLIRQHAQRPWIVWIIGLASGHMLGFLLKDVYVEVATYAPPEVAGASIFVALGSVWLAMIVLVLFSFLHTLCVVYLRHRQRERGGRSRCCRKGGCCKKENSGYGATAAEKAMAIRRGDFVIRESVADSYSVALGFLLYTAIYGLSMMMAGAPMRKYGGVFREEEPCFQEEEQVNATRRFRLLLMSSSEVELAENDINSDDSKDHRAVIHIVMWLVLFVLLPGLTWCAREKSKAILVSVHQASSKQRVLWGSVAVQLVCWGNALTFCLGFSFFAVLKSSLEDYAHQHPHQGGVMLMWISVFALLAFLASSSIIACSHTTRDMRQQSERASSGGEEGEHETTASQRWKRWRVEMFGPSARGMWNIFVGLAFEAFFSCAQDQITEVNHLWKTAISLVFVVAALVALLLVARWFGESFSELLEEELLEEIDSERVHRESIVIGAGLLESKDSDDGDSHSMMLAEAGGEEPLLQ